MKQYLNETKFLNYKHPKIIQLVEQRKWNTMNDFHKIKSIYEFVQNEVLFGYNNNDTLTSTEVLNDGYGQCNTKAILLMSLLRAVEIPCRLHALEVTKEFQRGATTLFIAALAPKQIVHTWVEVYYQDNWYALEGVILDKTYLHAIQLKYPHIKNEFKGYAIATKSLSNPQIDWNVNDTFIQKEAVVYDYGIYNSPDEFFALHMQHMSKLKLFLYSHLGRKIMNRNVNKIRNSFLK